MLAGVFYRLGREVAIKETLKRCDRAEKLSRKRALFLLDRGLRSSDRQPPFFIGTRNVVRNEARRLKAPAGAIAFLKKQLERVVSIFTDGETYGRALRLCVARVEHSGGNVQ